MPKNTQGNLKAKNDYSNLNYVKTLVNDLQKVVSQTSGKSQCLFITAYMYLAFVFLYYIFLALLIISAIMGSDLSFLLSSSVYRTSTSLAPMYGIS